LIESEDELAAVLGHEMAHVDNRHAIERLQYELASRRLGLGSLYQLGALAVEIFQAGYTKDQELEADRTGLGFAVSAGYSAGGGINLINRFQQVESDYTERAGSPIEEFCRPAIQRSDGIFPVTSTGR
jgi:beta-barrel assembly-enhancing protease